MKTKLVVALSFCLLSSTAIFAQEWSKNKKAVMKSVEKHKEELISISDKIWEAAEIAFQEGESSKLLLIYRAWM